MHKNLVILSAIIVLTLLILSSNTLSSGKVNKVISMAKNNDVKAIDVFRSFSNKDIKQFEKYLDKKPTDLPPIYFIIMADKVFDTNRDKAAIYYYYGRIRATEDAHLCEDKISRTQVSVYPKMAPKTLSYLAKSSNSYKFKVVEKALAIDKKYSIRSYNPIWACSYGLGAFGKKPELIPKNEQLYTIKEVRDNIEKALESYK